MLERLLEMTRQGGVFTLADLARRLDADAELVRAMLADLERRGRVHTVCSSSPAAACCGCPLAGGCHSSNT
ncbi:MAG: sugar metabolism transcriptional regulator [Anaerolineae bacterium]|nr:sugar metabolism transcriptional regulator [Anaerolineae bacterium]